jgi:hypothetical protein
MKQRIIERCIKLGSAENKMGCNNKKDKESTNDKDRDESNFPHLLITYIYIHFLNERSRIRT